MSSNPAVPPEYAHFFRALDSADALVSARTALARALADGFLALARERYTSPGASLRLSSLLYDGRESVCAQVRVGEDESGYVILEGGDRLDRADDMAGSSGSAAGIRRRRGESRKEKDRPVEKQGGGMFGAIPSAELREARGKFSEAVRWAVEATNCQRRTMEMLNEFRAVERKLGGTVQEKKVGLVEERDVTGNKVEDER